MTKSWPSTFREQVQVQTNGRRSKTISLDAHEAAGGRESSRGVYGVTAGDDAMVAKLVLTQGGCPS